MLYIYIHIYTCIYIYIYIYNNSIYICIYIYIVAIVCISVKELYIIFILTNMITIIAPSQRSEPGAYQTFTDSKCGRGLGCLPTRLRSYGRRLARYHFGMLANQKPGFSHVTTLWRPAAVINYTNYATLLILLGVQKD